MHKHTQHSGDAGLLLQQCNDGITQKTGREASVVSTPTVREKPKKTPWRNTLDTQKSTHASPPSTPSQCEPTHQAAREIKATRKRPTHAVMNFSPHGPSFM
eukprot:1321283-Rhodomonas_salina.1